MQQHTQVYTQAVSAIKAAGRRLPLAQTTVEDPPTKFSLSALGSFFSLFVLLLVSVPRRSCWFLIFTTKKGYIHHQ